MSFGDSHIFLQSSHHIFIDVWISALKAIRCIRAPTLQKKAFLACMYESGARPEEFLRLTSYDVRIDSNGAIFMLRGKTGERRVRIIAFAKLLQQWLEVHPLRDYQNFYPLWISALRHFKDNALGIRGAQRIIKETLPRVGLTNKHATLRHSRATHLAKHLTEAQMCTFFGWVQGTQVARRYVHLSGKDVDSALLVLNEEGGQTRHNSGHVVVPKAWIGKEAIVTLKEKENKTKDKR